MASLPTTTESTVEEDDAGRNQIALGIGNRPRSARRIEVGDDREGRAEVDSNSGVIHGVIWATPSK